MGIFETKCPGCNRTYSEAGNHPDVPQLCRECGEVAQSHAESLGEPWPKPDHTLHKKCFTCSKVEVADEVWRVLDAAERISRILYPVYACPDCRERIHTRKTPLQMPGAAEEAETVGV